MAAVIRTYVSANRLHAIRSYIPTLLRYSLEGSIKILPVTLNWTRSEKFNAIPNPNPIPNHNPKYEKNTTIYRAKTYISASKFTGQGVGVKKAYIAERL